MTIFDNMKTNDAPCEGVGPHRARVAVPLLERSGKAQALSLARCRSRGPPSAC